MNSPTPVQSALKWAFIAGSIVCIVNFFFLVTSLEVSFFLSIPTLIADALLLVWMLYSIYTENNLKDKKKEFIGTGTLACGSVGVILGLFRYLYLGVINPKSLLKIIENQRFKLIQSGLEATKIETFMSQYTLLVSPSMQLFFSLIYHTFLGFLLSILVSIIMQIKQVYFNK